MQVQQIFKPIQLNNNNNNDRDQLKRNLFVTRAKHFRNSSRFLPDCGGCHIEPALCDECCTGNRDVGHGSI